MGALAVKFSKEGYHSIERNNFPGIVPNFLRILHLIRTHEQVCLSLQELQFFGTFK